MSKRFIAILLFALIALTAALTACGGNTPVETSSESEPQPSQSEAQPESLNESAEESKSVEESLDESSEEPVPDESPEESVLEESSEEPDQNESSEEPAPNESPDESDSNESSKEPDSGETSKEPKPDDSDNPKGYLWMKGTGTDNPSITFKVPAYAIEDKPITIKALVKFEEDCQPNGGCVYLNMYSWEEDAIGNWGYLITFSDFAKDSEVEKGKWVEIDTSKTLPTLNPYNGTYDSTAYGGVNHNGGRYAPAVLTFGIGYYLATGTINVARISLEQDGKTLWDVDFKDEVEIDDPETVAVYENIRPDNKGVGWDIVGGKILFK